MIRALFAKPGVPARAVSERPEIERLFKAGEGTLWIDLEASGEEERDVLLNLCGFHPLAVEQCFGVTNHPRLTDYGEYLYLVFHGLRTASPLKTEEVDAFLGQRVLVTRHTGPCTAIEAAWKRSREVAALMDRGPDRVLAEVLDDVADAYLAVMETFDAGLDDIEDRLFKHAGRPALRDIFSMKKDILHLRRVVGPQREVLNRLSRGEFKVISKGEALLFRDIFDRIYRVSEMLESFRDVLAGAMEVYLTVVSNRTNDIVKVLTVFSIILMSTSLLAGIYGMNIEGLPFAKSPKAFGILVGTMVGITGALLFLFRRRRWI